MKKETLLKTITVMVIFAMALNANAQTWQLKCDITPLNNTTLSQTTWYALNVYKFDFKPSNQSEGLVIRRDSIRTTTNGGQTWSSANMIPQGGITGNFKTEAIGYTNNGNTIFSAVYNKIHKSTDGGVTFNTVVDTMAGEPKSFAANGNFLLFGYSGSRVAYSNDGGNTWTQKFVDNASSSVQDVQVVSQNIALIESSSQVYYTKNGGATRTRFGHAPYSKGTAITGVDDNVWFVSAIDTSGGGNASKLLKTTDGGITWTDLGTGVGAVYATTDGKLFAAIDENNSNGSKYKYSTDGGQTFTTEQINTDAPGIGGFKQIGSTLYALVNNGGNTSSKIYTLDLGGSVDIAENEIFNQLNVFPNPANNFITIANLPENSTVRIMDVAGRIVYHTQTTDAQVISSIDGWMNGMYFIRVESNGSVGNRKFIVQ